MILQAKGLLVATAGAGALILAMGTGWYITSLRLDAARTDAQQLRSDLNAERLARERVEGIAEGYEQRLQDARTTIDRQRADVDRGAARLRVAATCSVPADGTAAGEHHAGEPRLAPAAERNYWVLRERIAEITEQNKALQEYARACAERFNP